MIRTAIALALIAGTSAVVFDNTSPPTCHVDSAGRTVVFYSHNHPEHKSFLCTHSKKACTCARHPSHHHGKCRQFDHTTGKRLSINGDCGDSGRNPVYSSWGSWSRCTRTCGSGTTTRSRKCNYSASVCAAAGLGAATQSRTCNTRSCCRTTQVIECEGHRCIRTNSCGPNCMFSPTMYYGRGGCSCRGQGLFFRKSMANFRWETKC